jgi:hypothetical protein
MVNLSVKFSKTQKLINNKEDLKLLEISKIKLTTSNLNLSFIRNLHQAKTYFRLLHPQVFAMISQDQTLAVVKMIIQTKSTTSI